jgi:TonB family protein
MRPRTTTIFIFALLALASAEAFAFSDSTKVIYEAMPIEDIRKFVVYPPAEYKAGKEGTVKAMLLIDTSGHVQKVTIKTGTTTSFNDAVMNAAPKALYKPALDEKGNKIESWYPVTVVFTVKPSIEENRGPIPITDIKQLTFFPAQALQEKKEGRVELLITVGTDGLVKNAEVKSSTDHIFDGEAIEAAQHMLYKPALRGGKPVSTRFVLPVEFKLKK